MLTIAQMMQQHKETEEADRLAKEERAAREDERRREAIEAALSPFADELIVVKKHRDNYEVRLADWKPGVFRLGVHCGSTWDSAVITDGVRQAALNLDNASSLGIAFTKWQAGYEAELQERIEKASRWLGNIGCDQKDQQSRLEELLILAPERKEEWQERYSAWLAAYEAKQARTTQLEADKAAYVAAYQQWREAVTAVDAHNAMVVETIQAELDETAFDVWELERGLVAEDEDGTKWVETQFVSVLADEPDKDGYWLVVREGGHIDPRRLNFVSLSKPKTVRPSESHVAARTYATASMYVYFPPAQEHLRPVVQDRLVAELLPVPPKPDPNEYGLVGELSQRQIDGLTGGDDIPF